MPSTPTHTPTLTRTPTPQPAPTPAPWPRARYTMFKHMDDDQSGRIAYPEFVNGLRSVLHLTKVEMPQP